MVDTLIPVPFQGATLALIDHQGEPYAAMKPIAEAMGLTWDSQSAKINERFRAVASKLKATGTDGKSYSMVCLPLRKLPAWLATIQPNKTKPELRERIRAYLAECDDALWSYWTQGKAERAPAPAAPTVTPAQAGHGVYDPVEIASPPRPRRFPSKTQHYAAQAALLTSHLIEQTEFAGPEATYALLAAARASARNTLDLIEAAQNEVHHA